MRSNLIADGEFHPIRWTLFLAVAVPCLFLLLAMIAHGGGNAGLAHSSFRALRWIAVTELALFIALATVGAIYEYQHRTSDRHNFPPPGRLVDVGGYKLHLQCAGPSLEQHSQNSSPTVVLDSGLVGSVLDWRRVIPEVARFTRVCAYDRGGYGWSNMSLQPRTPAGITTDLHALLEKSGERPPYILVGHSLGGLNMWAYASRYPADVAGIVLVDSAHPQQSFPFPWRERLQLLLLRWSLPFGLPRWRGWCGGGQEEISRLKAAITCQPRYQASYYEQRAAMPEYLAEARELTPLNSIPLILVSRDPNRLESNASRESQWQNWQKDLSRISPDARLVIAKGSGHDIPGERPDLITKAIRDLLTPLPDSQ